MLHPAFRPSIPDSHPTSTLNPPSSPTLFHFLSQIWYQDILPLLKNIQKPYTHITKKPDLQHTVLKKKFSECTILTKLEAVLLQQLSCKFEKVVITLRVLGEHEDSITAQGF
jgi:hypothetical protein